MASLGTWAGEEFSEELRGDLLRWGRQPVRREQRPLGGNGYGVSGDLNRLMWMAGGGLDGLVGIRRRELQDQARGGHLACLLRPQSLDSSKLIQNACGN